MFQNYLTIALRNLRRNKLYTIINVLGMGIGIAAVVWGWLDYRFSFSFDNFHPDREQIFRAIVSKEDSEDMKGVCPLPMVLAAKEDFASIGEAVRLDSRGLNIKARQSEPFFHQAHFTDPAFFDLFNFPLVAGSRNLNDRGAVLLTEEMAAKFFGEENPLGQTLTFYVGEPYQMPLTVTGVLKNPPLNSSIRFNFITHFDNQYKLDGTPVEGDDWNWLIDAAFFKIPNPADAPRLAQDFKKYIAPQNSARPDWKVSGFMLEPLSAVADHDEGLSANGLYNRPEDSAAYGPLALALLIFLSACLNFTNTTVARSNRRLKEMGVRKVMGGTQAQLMRQMLLECGFIVLLASVLSVQLNRWWLPFFNQMFEGLEVKADYLNDPGLLGFMGLTILFATLLAGAYPAFYISRFNPTRIFSGMVKFGGTNLFSRMLLGVQVMVSLITVIAAVAFSKNAEFQRTYDYGYDRKNVMLVQVQNENTWSALRQAVQGMPGVAATAGTRHHIGFGYAAVVAEAKGEKKETGYIAVGDGYLDLMQLKLAAGRKFDPNLQSDYTSALLVSEKFAGLYGWTAEEALGQQVRIDTMTFSVAGTLKDFHIDNLFDPLEPVVMRLVRPDKFQDLVIRAEPGALNSTFDQVKAAWAKLFPLKPFNGFYQDEVAAEAMKVTTSIAQIFSWFAIVSILLTATGLFALVSLTVLKKMKEIAVRRIVGARPAHILALVNKSYLWVFLVAAIIGCYGGWALTKLLMDMIFRINVGVGPSTVLLSAAAVFGIALATVGARIWYAIRMNPSDVLKAE